MAAVEGPQRQGDDERNAALVDPLGLERHDYLDALATAGWMPARDDVRAVVRLVAAALTRVPILDERELRLVLSREWLEHFNVEPEGTHD